MDKAGELFVAILAPVLLEAKEQDSQQFKKSSRYKTTRALALTTALVGLLTLAFCFSGHLFATIALFVSFLVIAIFTCLYTGRESHSNDSIGKLEKDKEIARVLKKRYMEMLQVSNYDLKTVEACVASYCSRRESQKKKSLDHFFTATICVGLAAGLNFLFTSMNSIQCIDSNLEALTILANISIVIIVCSIAFAAAASLFWDFADNRKKASLRNANYCMYYLNLCKLL